MCLLNTLSRDVKSLLDSWPARDKAPRWLVKGEAPSWDKEVGVELAMWTLARDVRSFILSFARGELRTDINFWFGLLGQLIREPNATDSERHIYFGQYR